MQTRSKQSLRQNQNKIQKVKKVHQIAVEMADQVEDHLGVKV